jgi:hypothetical protein
VNTRWLRDGEDEMFTENPAEGFTKLIGLYRELSPEYQTFIMNQITPLLDIQARNRKT